MNAMTIADRLRKLRENKGMTQEQLAKKAELNLEDYRAMESGKGLENKERLVKACEALGIGPDDLLRPEQGGIVIFGDGYGLHGGHGYNNCTVDSRNEEDLALLNSMSQTLKNATSHLQIITDSIRILSQSLDDTVLAKKLEDLFRDFPRGRDDEKE